MSHSKPQDDPLRLGRDVLVPAFFDRLVAKVTEGFHGDVGVIPRQFLRKLVDVFDLVDQEEDYDPMVEEGFEPTEPTETEERLFAGRPVYDGELDVEEPYEPLTF